MVTYRGPNISDSIPDNIKNAASQEISKRNLKSGNGNGNWIGFTRLTCKSDR